MDNSFNFIAIGDIVTDAFIRLKDPAAHIDIDRNVREICMRFADKIPYEEVYVVPAVGNSANAAVSAARLGLNASLVSNVGDDYFGKECLDALAVNKVSTSFVKINIGFKTNYHYVLWYDADRTILVKHEEFPYELPDMGNPTWIYLSSLGHNSLPFHKHIEAYLTLHPASKLAFQPGTFQMKLGMEELEYFYKRADIFFCNKEEAQRILKTGEKNIGNLLRMMADLGPKITVITDGPSGAYAYDGIQAWSMRSYPDIKPPFERTGAGDAFSSTVTAALALGLDLKEALRWGPINAMSVVQQVGAQASLLSRSELETYLAKAPEDYYPKPL